jgi:hypothetical protein
MRRPENGSNIQGVHATRANSCRASTTSLLLAIAYLCALAPTAMAAPPPNDDRADATTLRGAFDGKFGDTNVGATKEPGEANHAGDAGGHSVWYRWTAPRSGKVEVDTCDEDTTFDTLLAVYSGSRRVGSNDDFTRNCGRGRSRVKFKAKAGKTYFIAVDGARGRTGKFDVFLYPGEPSGKYVSKTSQDKRISFRMSPSGKRIKGLKVGVRYRCRVNGRRRKLSETIYQESSDVIKFRNSRLRKTMKWRQGVVRYSFKLKGAFLDGAFEGTLRVRVTGPAGSCDTGKVRWSA